MLHQKFWYNVGNGSWDYVPKYLKNNVTSEVLNGLPNVKSFDYLFSMTFIWKSFVIFFWWITENIWGSFFTFNFFQPILIIKIDYWNKLLFCQNSNQIYCKFLRSAAFLLRILLTFLLADGISDKKKKADVPRIFQKWWVAGILITKAADFQPLCMNTQFVSHSTIVYLVKMEYGWSFSISDLKTMVKSWIEKIFLKFLHVQNWGVSTNQDVLLPRECMTNI